MTNLWRGLVDLRLKKLIPAHHPPGSAPPRLCPIPETVSNSEDQMCVRRHKEDHDVEEVTFQRLGQGCKVSSVQLKKKKKQQQQY